MSAAVIIIAAAIFLIGVVAGVVFIASVGIQREERDFRRTGRISMTRLAPDRVSYGTRGLVGLSVRRPEMEPVASRYQDTRYQDTLV
jgi:hypothetical protein